MGIEELLSLFSSPSNKMFEKAARPLFRGSFEEKEAKERGMRLIIGKAGEIQEGEILIFYWLVDEGDGFLVDVKYQLFGNIALIAAAETASELLLSKHYSQAKRVSFDLIDKNLRDSPEKQAFTHAFFSEVNLVLDAIENGVEKCSNLPELETYISTPLPREQGEKEKGGYPGWLELSKEQKLSVIEDVLNGEIRPYIELDAGGILVKDLIEDKELIIAYQGSCTSCYSAIGATLSSIQEIIQAKVHPQLVVVPDMTDLNL